MLDDFKQEVYSANMLLPKYGLVTFTWGNVSGFDADSGLVVIKPSGVAYDTLKPEDMVVVDLEGKIVDGKLKPSSDTDTHLEIYRNFKGIQGVVHTHSPWATSFAQAGRPIVAYGTTHADYFSGNIPCSRDLTPEEIKGDYERNTGSVIIETFENLNPSYIPGVLIKSHGPFAWGCDAQNAVHNAVVLEEVAKMAYHTEMMMGKDPQPMAEVLLQKHFYRKHGDHAYYGQ